MSSTARAGLVVGTLTALVLGPAVAAFANSANPTSASAKVWDCGQSNAPISCSDGVLVQVKGTWSWGELADQKSSPQQDCAGRYGVGWSVDWWGMSQDQTATPISGLRGTSVTPATKTSAPANSWGQLTPDGFWQVQASKLFFHTSAPFNGFLADLCNNAEQTSTGPIGDFTAYAIYPSRDAIPPQLCVNFYDPHGKQNQWSTSDGDNYANKDGDNSIKTNDFDPSTVSGNCFVPQDVPAPQQPQQPQQPKKGSPHLVVAKTGPATGTAGGTGTYTVTVRNNGDATKNGPISFVDELPAGESFHVVDTSLSDSGMSCQADTQNAQQVDCSYAGDLAAGSSKSVAIVVDYAPDSAGKSLTDCAGLMPAGATKCVTTVIPKPNALDLAILKTASVANVSTNDTLTYTLQVTNVSDQPTTGVVTVTDKVPTGLAIVGTPTGDGWSCDVAGAAVTCTRDSLAGGQAAPPITLTTTVLGSAASMLVNTGVVATQGDSNPANNRSTVRTPVTTVLGIKTVKPPTAAKPTAPQVQPTRASTPSALPFTGWNASTFAIIGLTTLLAGLRLVTFARRRRRA
jgi:uncharacterized repeat protein (TIGR01451 family)